MAITFSDAVDIAYDQWVETNNKNKQNITRSKEIITSKDVIAFVKYMNIKYPMLKKSNSQRTTLRTLKMDYNTSNSKEDLEIFVNAVSPLVVPASPAGSTVSSTDVPTTPNNDLASQFTTPPSQLNVSPQTDVSPSTPQTPSDIPTIHNTWKKKATIDGMLYLIYQRTGGEDKYFIDWKLSDEGKQIEEMIKELKEQGLSYQEVSAYVENFVDAKHRASRRLQFETEQGDEETKEEPVEFAESKDSAEPAEPKNPVQVALKREQEAKTDTTPADLNQQSRVKKETVAMEMGTQSNVSDMLGAEAPTPQDENNKTDTSGIERQSELPPEETTSLTFHGNYTEELDVTHAHLLEDKERGNLGAGVRGIKPIPDLWGNLPSQAREDKVAVPPLLFDTKQDGTVIQGDTSAPEQDKVVPFIPFAKVGGSLLWIPRHTEAAKFFFTSSDYDELISNIEDGNPLTLVNQDMVDLRLLWDTIIRLYTSFQAFGKLSPMLSSSATPVQVYAEWLELKQLSKAMVSYEQNTGGMFENMLMSMRGGIRAAVGAALKPLYGVLNVQEPAAPAKPMSGSMSGRKRAGEMGIVKDEDYNPQYSFEPLSLKRTKFSIPQI